MHLLRCSGRSSAGAAAVHRLLAWRGRQQMRRPAGQPWRLAGWRMKPWHHLLAQLRLQRPAWGLLPVVWAQPLVRRGCMSQWRLLPPQTMPQQTLQAQQRMVRLWMLPAPRCCWEACLGGRVPAPCWQQGHQQRPASQLQRKAPAASEAAPGSDAASAGWSQGHGPATAACAAAGECGGGRTAAPHHLQQEGKERGEQVCAIQRGNALIPARNPAKVVLIFGLLAYPLVLPLAHPLALPLPTCSAHSQQ